MKIVVRHTVELTMPDDAPAIDVFSAYVQSTREHAALAEDVLRRAKELAQKTGPTDPPERD